MIHHEADFRRDRWQRPEVVLPDGSRTSYTRATTMAATIADRFAIERWGKRQVALGIAARPDLVAGVSAFRTDDKKLDQLVAEAESAAAVTASATVGTAKHQLTADVWLDKLTLAEITPLLVDDVAAILKAETGNFEKVLGVEFHTINHDLTTAGTPDRLYQTWDGRACIGDLKTGRWAIDYAQQEISVQMASYAYGQIYDPATGETQPWPDNFDRTKGYVVHAPSGQPVKVFELDLARGWEAAALAFYVRRYRKEEVAHELATPAGVGF